MKKKVIGYIYWEKGLSEDERVFKKVAKKHNVDLVMINISKEFTEQELEETVSKCDVIYNNSAEEFAVEIVKTIEDIGKKVIEPSKDLNIQDKWILYLECKRKKIPVPETILLSESINIAKDEIKDFNKWPVILKRITGCCGDYVDMAHDIKEAEEIIKKFWKKGSERVPIIAQEYIDSKSYRVTVIDNKIMQTAIKDSNGWKKTGVYVSAKNIKKFKVDKELKEIVEKVMKVCKMKVCGIDLLKKDNKWVLLEINSEPAFDFFPDEREKLISQVVKLLKKA